MSQIEMKVYPDSGALFRAAADMLMTSLRAGLAADQRATFVLAGGETPRRVYELMASDCDPPDWSRVEFYWGDERCVPPDSSDSNYAMAHASLLARLSVRERNIHRIRAELQDSSKAARMYEEHIRAFVPGAPVPRFNLVLLGLGEDGHTASLFPGTQWNENRLVVTNFSPHPPFRRISMTPLLLNAAGCVVFLVSGTAKAHALKSVIEDPACTCPARLIRPFAGSLIWMADRDAASLLS